MIKEIFSLASPQWQQRRRARTLSLFRSAAQRVPAYKDFLKKYKINPAKIKSWNDFKQVPLTNKKNYLRQYPMEKLCWDGHLEKPLVFTATSGSTGAPFYFPRGEKLDRQAALMHEIFLRNTLGKNPGPTLIINAFGMGVWIGGLITYKAFEIFSRENNFPLSIITPGINKNEILNAVKLLAPHYSQVIIDGYPPFVKDILDEAIAQGINIKKLNLRFTFAAETFTEGFRDYMARKANIKNVFRDFFHIYGSADIGSMAAEMPAGILIKSLALKDKNVFKSLFGQAEKSPTVAQYVPDFITFEGVAGELALSGNNTIPLIRYALGDKGGVFSYKEAVEKLRGFGVNLESEAKRAGIGDCMCQLPFVYIYERADFSTSLYGIIIYPEYIRETLLDKRLEKWLTGRFTMTTKFDQHQDQYLEVNLELKKNIKSGSVLKHVVLNHLVAGMLKRSSEFKELVKHVGKRAYPRLIFWPAEDPTYFKLGVKQKWVLK